MILSLRELEALARALLSVLLALFDARVARHQTGLFQCGPQFVVVLNQRARDPMTNRPCLTRRTTAGDIDDDVKLGRGFSQIQRLPNNHAERLVREIGLEGFSVDLNLAATR